MGRNVHLCVIDMRLHHETNKAILVSVDGDKDKAMWLPKSQLEFDKKPKGVVTITMEEWLAYDKGLI